MEISRDTCINGISKSGIHVSTIPYTAKGPQPDLIEFEAETSFECRSGSNLVEYNKAVKTPVGCDDVINPSVLCVGVCAKGIDQTFNEFDQNLDQVPTFERQNDIATSTPEPCYEEEKKFSVEAVAVPVDEYVSPLLSHPINSTSLHGNTTTVLLQTINCFCRRPYCCHCVKGSCKCCSKGGRCCNCANEDDLVEVPHPLKKVNMNQTDFNTALQQITECSKLRHYTLFYNRFCQAGAFSVLFMLLWLGGSMVWRGYGLNMEMGLSLFAVAAVAVVLVLYVSCSCCRRKLNYTSKNALSRANETLLKHHVICTLSERGSVGCYSINLHFAHYDPGPCMERIQQVLSCALVRKHKKKKKSCCQRLTAFCCICQPGDVEDTNKQTVIDESDFMLVNTDVSQNRIQEFGRTLLHHYSHRYLSAMINGTVRSPLYTRHTPEKACLCQYIETEFFHLPWDTVQTIS